MKKVIGYPILFVFFFIGAYHALAVGFSKQEKVDCYQWKELHQKYPARLFSPSDEMIENCRALGVEI